MHELPSKSNDYYAASNLHIKLNYSVAIIRIENHCEKTSIFIERTIKVENNFDQALIFMYLMCMCI